MSFELTIGIPTYNRNEKLDKLITRLCVCDIEDVQILVVDNCSDIPVQATLIGHLNSHNHITIIRNTVNVGMAANILRVFENCKTEWLWLLSDDDTPEEFSINEIKATIESNLDFAYINFSCDEWVKRSNDLVACGPSDFLKKIDSFSNLLFLSNGVYNIAKVKNQLRFGYMFSHTLAPHIAVLLKALDVDSKVLFSGKKIVSHGKAENSQRWSMIPMSLGVMDLLQIPLEFEKETFEILSKHLMTHTLGPIPLLLSLFYEYEKGNSFFYIRNLYYVAKAKKVGYSLLKDRLLFGLIDNIFRSRLVFSLFFKLNKTRKQLTNSGERTVDLFNRI